MLKTILKPGSWFRAILAVVSAPFLLFFAVALPIGACQSLSLWYRHLDDPLPTPSFVEDELRAAGFYLKNQPGKPNMRAALNHHDVAAKLFFEKGAFDSASCHWPEYGGEDARGCAKALLSFVPYSSRKRAEAWFSDRSQRCADARFKSERIRLLLGRGYGTDCMLMLTVAESRADAND